MYLYGSDHELAKPPIFCSRTQAMRTHDTDQRLLEKSVSISDLEEPVVLPEKKGSEISFH